MTDRRPRKWEQLADLLRGQIGEGRRYPPGSYLPLMAEFAEENGVQRETARAAYKQLEAEGLIRTARRHGSRVQGRPRRKRISRGSTIRRDPHAGYLFPAAAPGEEWMTHGTPKREELPAPYEVAKEFGIEADTPLIRRRRVTSPKGQPPFQVADTWIAPAIAEEVPLTVAEDTGPGGYLDRIEEAGHGPITWDETWRNRVPEREEAKLLKIPLGMPVWESTIVGRSARTGEPVEVTIRVVPADRMELVGKLERSGAAKWPVTPAEPRKSSST